MNIRNSPGAQFEILVDGKPRSYRDIKAVSIRKRGIPQAAKGAGAIGLSDVLNSIPFCVAVRVFCAGCNQRCGCR